MLRRNSPLIVVTGCSGSGKTTLVRRFLLEHPVWCNPKSITTREPRVDDRSEYRFILPEDFKQNIDLFFEWMLYANNYYGTLKSDLEVAAPAIIVRDTQGAPKYVEQIQRAVSVFVRTPTTEALRSRMKKRGDTDNIVENRLKAVEQELEYSQKCNYIIVNDDFRIAYDDLKSIARAETLKNEA